MKKLIIKIFISAALTLAGLVTYTTFTTHKPQTVSVFKRFYERLANAYPGNQGMLHDLLKKLNYSLVGQYDPTISLSQTVFSPVYDLFASLLESGTISPDHIEKILVQADALVDNLDDILAQFPDQKILAHKWKADMHDLVVHKYGLLNQAKRVHKPSTVRKYAIGETMTFQELAQKEAASRALHKGLPDFAASSSRHASGYDSHNRGFSARRLQSNEDSQSHRSGRDINDYNVPTTDTWGMLDDEFNSVDNECLGTTTFADNGISNPQQRLEPKNSGEYAINTPTSKILPASQRISDSNLVHTFDLQDSKDSGVKNTSPDNSSALHHQRVQYMHAKATESVAETQQVVDDLARIITENQRNLIALMQQEFAH